MPGRPPRDAFLIGQRIYLRALRDEDADGPYAGWFNDEEVCRGNSHHVHPYPREAALAYIRDTHARKDSLVLAIAMIVLRRQLLLVAGVLSLLFMLGTLLALVLALTIGLFGIRETLDFQLVPPTLVVESIGTIILVVTTAMVFRLRRGV